MKRLLGIIVAVGLLASCAQIPDSGSVHKVDRAAAGGESAVRYAPAGPAKDASPREIVSGFLDAMLAYPVTTTVASSFLSPDGALSWRSSAGVQIYNQPEISAATTSIGNRNSVRVSLHAEATLDVQGRFASVGDDRAYTLTLSKVKGQWRIDNPPQGFLVNQKFFDDYYRPFSLYFFDRPGKRLVADPIYLPIGEQLTTSMMTSLLRGPRGTSARSHIPEGTELSTSATLQRDGLVDIQLKQDLIALPLAEQERLSAQIVWTLRQAEGVSQLRIVADGSEINPAGSGAQSVNAWPKFGPPASAGTFFAVKNNTIVRMSGRSVAVVSGPWGTDAKKPGAVAVNGSKEHIAVVSKDRRSIRVGGLSRGAKAIEATFGGTKLSDPFFDDRNHVWSLDRADDVTRLRLLKAGRAQEVPIGALKRLDVESFALAPGGSRYAAIADGPSGRGVYVGSVVTSPKDRVTALSSPRRIGLGEPALDDLHSIAWQSTGILAFLANSKLSGDQIFRIRIDGSTLTSAGSGPLLPDIEAVDLALTGGRADVSYVADKDQRMWWHAGSGLWEMLNGKGLSAPTYTY